jgi:arylsulfatase A-like enzyme
MPEEKNIILLVIDALRRDHMSCYGYNRETTPFMDRFAEENTRVEHFWSTSSHTREAVPSLMTGLYPHSAVNEGYEIERESIPEKLEQSSAAFHSNPFISRAYGYGKGFNRFHDGLNRGDNKILTLGKRLLDKILDNHYERAEKINRLSLDWIDSQDDLFFLWNQYMDVHGPYEPVEEFRGIYQDSPVGDRRSQILLQKARKRPEDVSEEERQRLIDLYDEEIRYIDSQIESFIQELKERGLYEDSIIVITSDHGEAFGEDGFYEHPRKLSNGLLRIPLLVKGLDFREEETASLVDLHQAITGDGSQDGKSPGNRERTVFAEVTEKRSKFSLYGAMKQEKSLYTRSKPGEPPEISGEFSENLSEFIENIYKETRTENIEDKDEEIKDKLEALGYGD